MIYKFLIGSEEAGNFKLPLIVLTRSCDCATLFLMLQDMTRIRWTRL